MKVLSVLFLLVAAAIVCVASLWAVAAARIQLVGKDADVKNRAPATTAPNTTLPPLLPNHYTAQFIEWTFINGTSPPYVNGVPDTPANPANLFKTFGHTYYDWETKPFPNMIEKRFQNCIDIFPGFSNKGWWCTFQNVGGVTYLISNQTTSLPPCCVFGDPWSPPPPNFLRHSVTAVIVAESLAWKDRFPTNFATWFEVPSIPPPTGPFYYSYTQVQHAPFVVLPEVEVFDSFSFPGIGSWIQQNFYEQRWEKPDPSVWQLPNECLPADKLPNCGFFGVDATKYQPFQGMMKIDEIAKKKIKKSN